jgi:dipeptidyl aminopeptidase/acylaminoacyl peptidase
LSGETVFFVESEDQRIWRLDPGFDPVALTPEPRTPGGRRYADGVVTPDGRWIICVEEAHPGEEGVRSDAVEPANRLVAVPATGGRPVVLREVADFVMSPRLDDAGERLAWVEWAHPSMPWDETELWVGEFEPQLAVGLQSAVLRDPHLVHGGAGVSVVGPSWDVEGRLWFCSDQTGWWNLYRTGEPRSGDEPENVAGGNIDVAIPPWVFGESRYSFLSDGRVVYAYTSDGLDHLAVYDDRTGRTDRIATEFTSLRQIRTSLTSLVVIGASFTSEATVSATLVGRGGAISPIRSLRAPRDLGFSSSSLSVGTPITFPTEGGISHGVFYAPANAEFVGPPGERPPLIVNIHGGPTASAAAELSLRTQFWTTRGFAYVDVNYRGSSGFGRRFRNELRGNWGIADVADCRAVVRFLASAGRVNADKAVIRGSSAGGFTALAALAQGDEFAAAFSLYGVTDLRLLASDTHKFESRYLDGLIAPFPEGAEEYDRRSPVSVVDQITAPVLLVQGTEDPVVPPDQAAKMMALLAAANTPVGLEFIEGEGHGFRSAENLVRCLELELSFYLQVFGQPEPPGCAHAVIAGL